MTNTRSITNRSRKKKEVTNCKHTLAKHYAKGMCNYCYHVYGRNKKASVCPHKDQLVYAKGRCHKCYNASFIKKAALSKRSAMSTDKTAENMKNTVASQMMEAEATVTEDEVENE